MNSKLIKAQAGQTLCVAPGIVKLHLTEQKTIDAFPAVEDYYTDPVANNPLVISTDITFDTVTYPDAGWYEWDIMPESTDWKPTLQGPLGAQYWQTIIPLKLAGHDALLDQAVDWAKGKKLVALLEDVSGKKRVIGNKSIFCSWQKIEGTQGAARGDFSGWDMELILPVHCALSPYYTGAITPIFTL